MENLYVVLRRVWPRLLGAILILQTHSTVIRAVSGSVMGLDGKIQISNFTKPEVIRPVMTPELLPSGIYRYEDFGNPNKTTLLPNGEDVEEWVPPYNMSRTFPYYQAGYDHGGRPFWVFELGKWNLASIEAFRRGDLLDYQLFAIQVAHRLVKSARSSADGKLTVLADLDNLKISQFYYMPILKLSINYAIEHERYLTRYAQDVIAINVNYAAETLYLFMRPVLGRAFQNLEAFGNKRSQWQPHLFRRVPSKFIPPQYGGDPDFRPIQT